MPHKYGADLKTPWTIYWVHFKGTQAMHYTSLLTQQLKTFVKYSPFIEERIRVFDTIYKTLEAGYSADNLAFSSIGLTYFLGLLNYTDKFKYGHPSTEKDPIDQSIDFMQNHLDTQIELKSIATAVNLSVSQYSSIFKKTTGYSPIEYFNHLKVQHACQYLQFTTLRINEIAFKLGIEDPYYFSRLFSKIMGISPQEYRSKKN